MTAGPHTRRIDHLDGLRAVAALTVVAQHTIEFSFLYQPGSGWPGWVVQHGFSLGRYGVAVFFLVSGFLIPSSIAARPGALRDFATSRFFRLYPLYWASLLAALLLYPALKGETFPPATILANATMLQTLFGVENVIGLYWTLFVEFVFYALCAALFALGLLHRSRTPLVLVALMGGAMAASSLWTLAIGVAGLGGAMMKLGTFAMYLQLMFLGQALRNAADRGTPASARLALALTVGSLAIYCGAREVTGVYAIGLTPLCVFSATLAAMATFLASGRAAFLRHAVTAYLGRVSYGLYLFHAIAIVAAVRILPHAPDWTTTAALFLGVVAVSTAAAALAHRLIEKPAIALGRQVRRREAIASPRAEAAALK